MAVNQSTRPFARAAAPGTSWWYSGCLVTSLAESDETAGQISVVDVVIRKGMEPPPHTHTREDEAFYVIDGHLTFQAGDKTIDGPPGAFVWLPRGVQHAWTLNTDAVRALIFTTPGGFLEAMFRPFSEPAPALALPPAPVDLPIAAMIALDRELGVEYPPSEPD